MWINFEQLLDLPNVTLTYCFWSSGFINRGEEKKVRLVKENDINIH
jgi:hypothetical protein